MPIAPVPIAPVPIWKIFVSRKLPAESTKKTGPQQNLHLLFKRRPKAVGVCWQSLYGRRSILTVLRPFSWVGGALIGRPTGFLCSTNGFNPRYIPWPVMKPLRLFRDSAVNLGGRIARRDRKRTERLENASDNVFSYKKHHWTLFWGHQSVSGVRRSIG